MVTLMLVITHHIAPIDYSTLKADAVIINFVEDLEGVPPATYQRNFY